MRPASSFVSDSVTFTPEIIAATKAFARSKPWKGTVEERKAKFQDYHSAMCKACDIQSKLTFVYVRGGRRSGGRVIGSRLVLAESKLSVVTYLYWFAELIYGRSPEKQMTFAINLYKQRFPRSFASRDLTGPTVR